MRRPSQSELSDSSFSFSMASPPSSVPSDDEQVFDGFYKQHYSFVQRLLHEKQQTENEISAWKVRCESLELEVRRLVSLLSDYERDRQQLLLPRSPPPMPLIGSINCSPKSIGTDLFEIPISPRLEYPCPDWRSSIDSSPILNVSSAHSAFSDSSVTTLPVAVVATTSTASPTQTNAQNTSNGGQLPRLQVDPSKSMSRQSPAPCNAFYILGTCQVPKCKFAHNYDLKSEHIDEMKRGAKFRLCNTIKNGHSCVDPSCFFGHVCPRGTSCSRANCAFNDEQHKNAPTPRLMPCKR